MKSIAPGVVIGSRYVLTRPLAKGGMGSVWIARHRELDVDVTVKFMMPTLVNSAELRGRFEREAKVAARLRSQYVVQVLDFGIDDEMPYIAMELLQGESLADRLKREPRLPLLVAARILTQICKALRTAHEAGLVHRDLKPGNIFLALKDGEEVVKVLDFGIVKDTAKNDADEQAGATETGVMMGSVHYMSPEQIRSSRQVDHRSDLWSVAVILYKMLTGNAPFPGTNQGDVMVRVCTDSCPPPSAVVPGLPPAIDTFFARALTRDPAGRFQSAQEMADVLVAAANMDPVLTTAAHPAPKWVKTLPLMDPAMRSAIAAAGAPPPPSHEGTAVAGMSEMAMGTFQAVTMAPGAMGAAPQARPTRSNSQKGLIVGVAVGFLLLGGLLLVLAMQKESAARDTTTQKPISSVMSSAAVSPPEPPTAHSIPSVVPVPTNSVTAAPVVNTARPVNTAAPATTSKTPTQTRKNPLDIND
jgi:eukaryotic-like serine/threonine-protein kinase